MSEVKRYTLPEVPHLVHGRTNGSLTPLTLFWTAAGLELNVRGTETKLYVKRGLCKLNMCILYIG